MPKKFVILFVILLSLNSINGGWACTTFVIKNGDMQVFGRNYDWMIGDALLMVNKPGCKKHSLNRPEEKGEKAIWAAKYGSITFNQYGRELPMGGMNEAGLVVESMSLSETQYPAPDGRPYLGSASQWRQYVLDTCATVAEVIAVDRKVRISNSAIGPGIHVLVLDRKGDRAAIEFLDGKMKVYTGNNLPVAVLTNTTYEKSLKCLQATKPPVYDRWKSVRRFITAAKLTSNYKDTTIDTLVSYAFDTLSAVSSPRTQWRIVYDNINMMVYFLTRANNKLRQVRFPDFDISPQTLTKVLDVNANVSGDVTKEFSDYTYEANRNLIADSFKKTSFLENIPYERLDALARFPEQFECP
jgi:penicillin V acylase-like amidase (Ntn superfamily)